MVYTINTVSTAKSIVYAISTKSMYEKAVWCVGMVLTLGSCCAGDTRCCGWNNKEDDY